jgi:hypothetical protein
MITLVRHDDLRSSRNYIMTSGYFELIELI